MALESEVASFLKDFKDKMRFWNVLFRDDRGKNAQALAVLELRPIERTANVIKLRIFQNAYF